MAHRRLEWDIRNGVVLRRGRAHGIPTTIRDTRGQDIDGACGQLAASTA